VVRISSMLVAPWSALKSLDTGRLGYLGSLASGNLAGEEAQYALYKQVEHLPQVVLETGAFCWIGLKSHVRTEAGSVDSGDISIALPVSIADIEVAYFTSESRRREFQADLKVSGFTDNDLPFTQLVLPGDVPPVRSVPSDGSLVGKLKLLNDELAYQERISAAISCANSMNWWRAKDLPGLRSEDSSGKYSRLTNWARSAQGVVDADGRWSRTSIEQTFPSLEAAGLGDQISVYRTYVEGDRWPITESALVASALLMLARTEGGTPDSVDSQILALNGIALPAEYALADAMIYIAVAFARHQLPKIWRVQQDQVDLTVRDEIRFAALAYLASELRLNNPTPSPVIAAALGAPEVPIRRPRKVTTRKKTDAEPVAEDGTMSPLPTGEQLDWPKADIDQFITPEVVEPEVKPAEALNPLVPPASGSEEQR
jgi:hypothetical protein